jgi:glucosyl-dolichyl phosphate glucuronosyltransferase
MNLSVILCTYNRSGSLPKALESLAASELPEDVEWEVLVVDNNSKDDTRAVIEGFCQRYPGRFRYLLEPRQGKSFALNAAIHEARGEIFAFVDDDVTVEPTWLRELTLPLRDGAWAGSGGRILPERGFVPPRWLALDGPCNMIGAICAYCDHGDLPGELKAPLVGANMAIRREMFEKYGGFRTDLGPRPGSELRHEDSELSHRLVNSGERLRYVPTAIVHHEIHEDRVSRKFLLAWYFDFGRGSVRLTGKSLSAKQTLRTAARLGLTAFQWLVAVDPRWRFYHKCWIWLGAGKLFEAYRLTMETGYKAKRQQESI